MNITNCWCCSKYHGICKCVTVYPWYPCLLSILSQYMYIDHVSSQIKHCQIVIERLWWLCTDFQYVPICISTCGSMGNPVLIHALFSERVMVMFDNCDLQSIQMTITTDFIMFCKEVLKIRKHSFSIITPKPCIWQWNVCDFQKESPYIYHAHNYKCILMFWYKNSHDMR